MKGVNNNKILLSEGNLAIFDSFKLTEELNGFKKNVVSIQRLRKPSILQILQTDNAKDRFLKSKENLKALDLLKANVEVNVRSRIVNTY